MDTTVKRRLEELLLTQTPEQLTASLIAKMIEARKAKEAHEAGKAKAPVVTVTEAPKVEGPKRHYKFELLRRAAMSGVDAIALVGPAGSGKTTACRHIAEFLNRPFEAVSFGPTTSKADLFGFVDANGTYRDTGLVRAAVKGGVFLGDELDAGNAGVVVGLNMVTANPVFSTPKGMETKHKDFLAFFGMNTFGSGADRQYVGRNQLDAASMDRMAVIDWDVDRSLEAALIGCKATSPYFDIAEGGILNNDQWLDRVWNIRKAIEGLKIRHIVSPRATQNGAKLFAQGIGRRHVEDMVIWKGLDRDTRNKIEANCQ